MTTPGMPAADERPPDAGTTGLTGATGSTGALLDMLAAWLPDAALVPRPRQRAVGAGPRLRHLAPAGDPALRHLIVQARLLGGDGQVPGAGRLPGSASRRRSARPDRLAGRRDLLRRAARSGARRRLLPRHRASSACRAAPVRPRAGRARAGRPAGRTAACSAAEQSNTSLVFGDLGDPEGAAPAVPRRQPRPGGRRRARPAWLGPGGGALRLDRDRPGRRAGAARRAVGVPGRRQRWLDAGARQPAAGCTRGTAPTGRST